MNPGMSKPTVLAYGNCQASALAQTFAKLPGIADAYEVKYLPSFAHPVTGLPPIPKDWLDRCIIFLEQKGVWGDFERKSELPAHVALLSYPTVSMRSLWPLQANDPRNVSSQDFPFGQYPYGDRWVLELLDAGYADEALLTEYMRRDLLDQVDLDRLSELEQERQRLADAACDIKLADFIRANFQSRRLFWSHNHPASELHKHAFRSILAELGALGGGLDDSAVSRWLDECYQNWEPTGEISVAIHPQVVSHFQLGWVDERTRYWHFRGKPAGYREYMLDYIRFAPQPGEVRVASTTVDSSGVHVPTSPVEPLLAPVEESPGQDDGFKLIDGGRLLLLKEPPDRLRRVTVEVTTWCNLECPGCLRTQGSAAGSWSNRHMSVETFTRVTEHLPPCDMLVMHGVGEPSMNPDYLHLIDIAKASGKFGHLHCNTNAMARSTEFYCEMVERGLDSFSVSVDSLKPEIVQLTRTGTDVEKLHTRLKLFHSLNLPFHIQMVVSRLNYDDIFFTLYSLNQIGPRTVFIQPFIDHVGAGNALTREMAVLFMMRLRNLEGQFGNLTIRAGGFRSLGIVEDGMALPMCTSPWLDPAINADGFLTPCCVHWDASTLGLCNLAEISFAEAWRSESVQHFMAEYVRKPPGFCSDCSENVRREPGV